MITYRALELEASPSTIGAIAALYALLPVLLALKFGKWVGVVGEGRFVIVGTLAMVASSTTLIVARTVTLLMFAAALAGLAHLACMVGGQTMVSLRAPQGQYERYFGYYTFSASLGQLVGPMIAVIVAGSTGVIPKSTTSAFLAALVLSIVALFPILRWRNEVPTVRAIPAEGGALREAITMLKRPRILGAIYTSMAISSVGDILVVFLPVYGQEKKFSSMTVGVLIAIRAGASMLSRLSLGLLSERFTSKKILMTSTFISMLSLALLILAGNEYVVALLILIAGFALGVGQPLTMSEISHLTQPQERALAVSARLTGNRFGQFVIPAGAGALAGSQGMGAVFMALSLLLASTFISTLN